MSSTDTQTVERILRDAINQNRDISAIPAGGALSGIEKLFTNPSFERGVAGSLVGLAAGDLINYFISHPADKATSTGTHLRYAVVDTHNNTVIKYLSAHRLYRLLTRPRGRSRTRKVVVVRQQPNEINVR